MQKLRAAHQRKSSQQANRASAPTKTGRRPTAKRPAAEVSDKRRSPCPVACALDLFGDRWTLLVVRDLMLGRSRFKDFTASPEGIPTNILSERLVRLQHHGIVEQRPVSEGSKRLAYQLTDKGDSLRGVMRAMKEWGLQWEPGTAAKLEG